MPHKILALKDRPEYAAALKHLLEPHGYDVIAVDNIDDALRVLDSERVDMVVLSIHLQEGNVFDFIRIVRSGTDPRRNSVPIICLNLNPQLHSDHLGQSLSDGAKSLGASQFITMEPYAPATLWIEIEKWLPREPIKLH